MAEKPYHHGNLQTELIEEGLALIHEEGMANFSLRKLVKRIGVSPTACYNHYKNIEDLLCAMKEYVTRRFSEVLVNSAKNVEDSYAAIEMGKAYVVFFAEHPHYFTFIYDNEDYSIKLTENAFDGDYEPFQNFKEIAIRSLKAYKIPPENFRDNLIVMWATVHGLAAMANMKGFHYDGEWGSLTESILEEKLTLR
ncbi:MAG: TetR/AcrR family transcriptional regulator [Lachnospiraceae bacterium]|nr:TetR/AcrR family transcriptional regulator [Lachnospiraceae bacterium]